MRMAHVMARTERNHLVDRPAAKENALAVDPDQKETESGILDPGESTDSALLLAPVRSGHIVAVLTSQRVYSMPASD